MITQLWMTISVTTSGGPSSNPSQKFNSSATPENSQLVYISSVENFNLVMFQLALDPTCAYAINTAEVK